MFGKKNNPLRISERQQIILSQLIKAKGLHDDVRDPPSK